MFARPVQKRPGTTLIELLIVVTILAIVAMSALPLLFASTEDRLLQQTVSIVEQNGGQILQTIGQQIHRAERILSPVMGSTGSVLALQSGSGSTDPMIIGLNSGSLLLVQHATSQLLSSSQVAVQNFSIRNTSVSSSRQSVFVRFSVTRSIRLQAPRTYTKTFEALFTLFPDDVYTGNACSCAMPGCAAGNNYVWQVCEEGQCLTAQAQMQCP